MVDILNLDPYDSVYFSHFWNTTDATISNHSQSFPTIPNHSLSKEIQNRSFTINIYDKFNYYGNIHIPRTPQFHSDNYYSLILFYLSQDKQYIKIYLSDMFFVQVGRVVHGNFTSRDVI